MTPGAVRRKLWFALFLAVAFVAPYYWLLCDNHASTAAVPDLTLADLRAAANAMPGEKPDGLRLIAVASRLEAGTLLVAGGGVRRIEVGDIAIVLRSPSGDTVIDSGPAPSRLKAAKLDRFSKVAAREVQAELSHAAHIAFTSDSPETVGGFLASANLQRLSTKVVPSTGQSVFAPGVSARALPLTLSGHDEAAAEDIIRPVAPGVVQIDAPAYGAGGKMYFVSFASGAELLVAGEAVPTARNLGSMRLRSRLWTDILHPSDRGVARAWLNTVARWKESDKRLVVLPGRDIDWLRSNAAALERDVANRNQVRPK